MQSKREVIGYFQNQNNLNRCVNELRDADFATSSFKTFRTHPNTAIELTFFGKVKKNLEFEAGMAGIGIGASLGAMLGFLFGNGYLDFFHTGAPRSFGPYFSLFFGAVLGAVLGTVIGAFVGQKITVENLDEYGHRFKSDEVRLSVAVNNESEYQLARFILEDFGAYQISDHFGEGLPNYIYKEKPISKKTIRSNRESSYKNH